MFPSAVSRAEAPMNAAVHGTRTLLRALRIIRARLAGPAVSGQIGGSLVASAVGGSARSAQTRDLVVTGMRMAWFLLFVLVSLSFLSARKG